MTNQGRQQRVGTTWEEFSALAAANGLQAVQLVVEHCPSVVHWQFQGGAVLVNYWPNRGTWKAQPKGQEGSPLLKGPAAEAAAVAAGRVSFQHLAQSQRARPVRTDRYRVSWGEFCSRVRDVGLTPYNCAGTTPMWQIRGGDNRVNFWPGTGAFQSLPGGRVRHGLTLSDAIACARGRKGRQVDQRAPVEIPRGSKNPRDWERVLASLGLRAI